MAAVSWICVMVSWAGSTSRVSMPSFARVQNLDHNQVEDKGGKRDPEHAPPTHVVWVKQARPSLAHKEGSHGPYSEDRAKGSQHLNAVVTERVLRICASMRNMKS